ncbi:uncharacterized protein LOC127585576 isoform X2 [Pristis pectinata]|uniref:uncharacterized protein LOC127585576 isoform X2 n=1 Tax=Pristis pectinata TaxID=685728 RepID=UPI00223CCC5B|nr:uncharacterized protein LOC127585576 isoform X2 [Pristis pectinata]
MSLSGRILIGLFLYIRQGQTEFACQIQQKQLIVVAVVNEDVSFHCEYRCESTNKSAPLTKAVSVTMLLYKDMLSNALSTPTDSTFVSKSDKVWQLTVRGMNYSGMYYCHGRTQSKSFVGRGTLLRVVEMDQVQLRHIPMRDKERTNNPRAPWMMEETQRKMKQIPTSEEPPRQMLVYLLVGISLALVIYSLSVTVVVIIKRKTCSRCKSYWMKLLSGNARKPSATDQVQSITKSLGGRVVEPPEDENAYMALQRPQESMYSSLHNGACNVESTCAADESPRGVDVEPAEAEAEVYECVYETF